MPISRRLIIDNTGCRFQFHTLFEKNVCITNLDKIQSFDFFEYVLHAISIRQTLSNVTFSYWPVEPFKPDVAG